LFCDAPASGKLGTNDFQFSHPFNNAWSAAQGIAALVREIHNAPIEPGMPVPRVLVVCPPLIRSPKGSIAPKFSGSEERYAGLPEAYAKVAVELDCAFFDAGSVTSSSGVDGVHLDRDQHLTLGNALVEVVKSVLSRTR
jgi:lysophospholipase L1-like esterase